MFRALAKAGCPPMLFSVVCRPSQQAEYVQPYLQMSGPIQYINGMFLAGQAFTKEDLGLWMFKLKHSDFEVPYLFKT